MRQHNTDTLEYGIRMWLQIIGYKLIYFDTINGNDELRSMVYTRLSLSNYSLIDSIYYQTCIDYQYSPFSVISEIGQYIYYPSRTVPSFDMKHRPRILGYFSIDRSMARAERERVYWERKNRVYKNQYILRKNRVRAVRAHRRRTREQMSKYAMIKGTQARKAAKAAHTKQMTHSKQSSHMWDKNKAALKSFYRKR